MSENIKQSKLTSILLNIAHTIDHAFLLIFAAVVVVIAQEFHISNWQDLMPYNTGAFICFGLLSIVAGKLADNFGRKPMMMIFFMGMSLSLLLISQADSALEIGIYLTILGVFSAIYHPVGIPMLLQGQEKYGKIIGFNGLFGNLGVAIAALMSGFIMKYFGWRMAFILPAGISFIVGIIFWLNAHETESPKKRPSKINNFDAKFLFRLMIVMIMANVGISFLFNFTTNANGQLLQAKFQNITNDPAQLGLYLALIYGVASFVQLFIGRCIDKYSLKSLYAGLVAGQVFFVILTNLGQDWLFYLGLLGWMSCIFGAIPFTDAMIGKYIDDRMRSSVAGMRLTISFGISSFAVWLIGPAVKSMGYDGILWVMMAVSLATLIIVSFLPKPNTP